MHDEQAVKNVVHLKNNKNLCYEKIRFFRIFFILFNFKTNLSHRLRCTCGFTVQLETGRGNGRFASPVCQLCVLTGWKLVLNLPTCWFYTNQLIIAQFSRSRSFVVENCFLFFSFVVLHRNGGNAATKSKCIYLTIFWTTWYKFNI